MPLLMSTTLWFLTYCMIVNRASSSSWIPTSFFNVPPSKEKERLGKMERELAGVRQRSAHVIEEKERDLERMTALLSDAVKQKEDLQRELEMEIRTHDEDIKSRDQRNRNLKLVHRKEMKQMEDDDREDFRRLKAAFQEDLEHLQFKLYYRDEMMKKQQSEQVRLKNNHEEAQLRTYNTMVQEMENQAEVLKSEHRRGLEDLQNDVKRAQTEHGEEFTRLIIDHEEQLDATRNQGVIQQSEHQMGLKRMRVERDIQLQKRKFDHEEELKRSTINHEKQLESCKFMVQGMRDETDIMQSEHQRELNKGRKERDAQLETYHKMIQQRKSDHEEELKRLRIGHEEQLETYKLTVQGMRNQMVTQQSKHDRAQSDREKELKRVRQEEIRTGRDEMERQAASHQEEMANLQEEKEDLEGELALLENELEEKESEHLAEIERLKTAHADRVETLQSSVVDTQQQLANRGDELAMLTRANQEEIENSKRCKREVEELEKEKSEWDGTLRDEHERFIICTIVIVVLVVAILSGFGAFVARWCCKIGKNIAEKGIDGKMPKMKLSLANKIKADIP